MTKLLVEDASYKAGLISEIADSLIYRFRHFPPLRFAGEEYDLISPQGLENIRQHLTLHLEKIPFTKMDSALLYPATQHASISTHETIKCAVVGYIKIKVLPARHTTHSDDSPLKSALSSIAMITGNNVEANGLCLAYFAAMSTRVGSIGWNATTQLTGFTLASLTSKFKRDNKQVYVTPSAHGTVRNACMKDELIETKLSSKVIALAVRKALLSFYSDQELLMAMIELHNIKASFTVFLRENSNVVSGFFGKDTDSWLQAVAQVRDEAQHRLNQKLQQDESASTSTAVTPSLSLALVEIPEGTEHDDKAVLQAIVSYSSGLFSATESVNSSDQTLSTVKDTASASQAGQVQEEAPQWLDQVTQQVVEQIDQLMSPRIVNASAELDADIEDTTTSEQLTSEVTMSEPEVKLTLPNRFKLSQQEITQAQQLGKPIYDIYIPRANGSGYIYQDNRYGFQKIMRDADGNQVQFDGDTTFYVFVKVQNTQEVIDYALLAEVENELPSCVFNDCRDGDCIQLNIGEQTIVLRLTQAVMHPTTLSSESVPMELMPGFMRDDTEDDSDDTPTLLFEDALRLLEQRILSRNFKFQIDNLTDVTQLNWPNPYNPSQRTGYRDPRLTTRHPFFNEARNIVLPGAVIAWGNGQEENVQSSMAQEVLKDLRYLEITGPGHCLFEAICVGMHIDVSSFRKVIVKRMEAAFATYKPYRTDSDAMFRAYITDIREGREKGDDIEIEIIQAIIKRPIIIIRSKGNPSIPHNADSYPGAPIFIYQDGYHHYDRFIPIQNAKPRDILTRMQTHLAQGQSITYPHKTKVPDRARTEGALGYKLLPNNTMIFPAPGKGRISDIGYLRQSGMLYLWLKRNESPMPAGAFFRHDSRPRYETLCIRPPAWMNNGLQFEVLPNGMMAAKPRVSLEAQEEISSGSEVMMQF